MVNTAVIAEYNPFHLGHLYHLQEAKRLTNADCVTVIMSGSFVQRAEPAAFSKEARVRMALECGADIVLELPAVNVLQSAERYALGAVSLAQAVNADYLVFGSECGETEKLGEIADILLSDNFGELLQVELQKGLSFPSARAAALNNFSEEYLQIVGKPNNILGIEYIKAIKKLESKIKPVTVARKGAGHDSDEIQIESASASRIRKLLQGKGAVADFVPQKVNEIIASEIGQGRYIVNKESFERAVLAFLRTLPYGRIADATDCAEGLEYRITDSLDCGATLDEVIDNAKTKRYTHSRLRRIILSAYLGITKDTFCKVPYIRLLGMKKQASSCWLEIKNGARLPVIERLAKSSNDENVSKILQKEAAADEIWSSFSEKVQPYGENYRKFPVIL